jgi:hypothetical protein
MKRAIVLLIVLLLGSCIGLYFGYTRPVARQYRLVRDQMFHMTDKDMADAGTQVREHLPQFIEGMKRSDDLTAAIALSAVERIDQGNTEGAKKLLLVPVRNYYQRYSGKGGDPQILARIEAAAQKNHDLAVELQKKGE